MMEKNIKHEQDIMGEKYLLAFMKCAAWVPQEYKILIEKYQKNIDLVKELYLCCCDGVLVEKLIPLIESNEFSLSLLQDLRKRQIAEEINQKSIMVPESLFPEQEPPKVLEEDFKEDAEMRNQKKQQLIEESEFPGTSRKEEKDTHQQKKHKKEKFPKKNLFQRLKAEKKEEATENLTIPDFVNNLVKEGYQREQVDYIVSCMEEGVTQEEIKKFIAPNLPVDIMKRLRKLEEGKKHGK